MPTYREELLKTPKILNRLKFEKTYQFYSEADNVVFCGCGTSLYIGGQIAKICNENGHRASAVDAVDLADEYYKADRSSLYVFISRSGTSLETVLAMRNIKQQGCRTFYLGCRENSVLAKECDNKEVIEYAEEENILESYSYYAQFTLGCMCCGMKIVDTLSESVTSAIKQADSCYEEYCKDKNIKRIILLSPSSYDFFAREMMLKNGEITLLPSEAWRCLEFRHGPRAWADETTLIEFIPGTATEFWDINVAKELIGYHCPLILFSEKILDDSFKVEFDVRRHSPEEIICFGVFITELAVKIGKKLGTTPEQLKHVVHNVGGL